MSVPVTVQFSDRLRMLVLLLVQLTVQLLHAAPEATVIVPFPEAESTMTLSDDVGAEAPEPPPVVVDQCVVEDASHVPDPPTQYRFAMLYQ